MDDAPRPTGEPPVSCAVITVADGLREADDASGVLARERLHAAGHPVEFYRIVPDDPERIRAVLVHLAGRVDVVVTCGGTGIARRDVTVDVALQLIRKPLPGFGELFRTLAYERIGAAAMLTRAVAGVYAAPGEPDEAPTLLFCCPDAPDAVALALDRLIVPELRHLVRETIRPEAPPEPPSSEVGAPAGEASAAPGEG